MTLETTNLPTIVRQLKPILILTLTARFCSHESNQRVIKVSFGCASSMCLRCAVKCILQVLRCMRAFYGLRESGFRSCRIDLINVPKSQTGVAMPRMRDETALDVTDAHGKIGVFVFCGSKTLVRISAKARRSRTACVISKTPAVRMECLPGFMS